MARQWPYRVEVSDGQHVGLSLRSTAFTSSSSERPNGKEVRRSTGETEIGRVLRTPKLLSAFTSTRHSSRKRTNSWEQTAEELVKIMKADHAKPSSIANYVSVLNLATKDCRPDPPSGLPEARPTLVQLVQGREL